jgi:ABC-type glycerol-3-phosphate transport system substrate-binding protein
MDWDTVHPAWRDALTDMAELWERPSLFPRHGASPRQTRWEDLASRLTGERADAEVAFGPSFLANQIDEGQLYPFGFPAVDGRRPLVVGGDIAVVPTDAPHPTGAQAFVRWLTDAEAIDEWGDVDDGYLTPNVNSPYIVEDEDDLPPPDNEDNLRVYLTHQLRHPPHQLDDSPGGACAGEEADGDLLFDLSDDQLSIRNEGNPHRNWDLFAAFFDDVTRGRTSQSCAIERAIQRLQDEYEGAERWRPAPC